jgi:hypothetical protein
VIGRRRIARSDVPELRHGLVRYLTVIFSYRILFFDFVRVTENHLREHHEIGIMGIL